MAVVFEKTKGLTDAKLHYCPGCVHGDQSHHRNHILLFVFSKTSLTRSSSVYKSLLTVRLPFLSF